MANADVVCFSFNCEFDHGSSTCKKSPVLVTTETPSTHHHLQSTTHMNRSTPDQTASKPTTTSPAHGQSTTTSTNIPSSSTKPSKPTIGTSQPIPRSTSAATEKSSKPTTVTSQPPHRSTSAATKKQSSTTTMPVPLPTSVSSIQTTARDESNTTQPLVDHHTTSANQPITQSTSNTTIVSCAVGGTITVAFVLIAFGIIWRCRKRKLRLRNGDGQQLITEDDNQIRIYDATHINAMATQIQFVQPSLDGFTRGSSVVPNDSFLQDVSLDDESEILDYNVDNISLRQRQHDSDLENEPPVESEDVIFDKQNHLKKKDRKKSGAV